MILSRRKLQHFYIGLSSRYLGNRIKVHHSDVTSKINKHSVSNNQPKAQIPHFKIIDQESRQVARDAREAICIRINTALNNNTGKMDIPEIFSYLLGADRSTNESNQVVDSDLIQGHMYFTIPNNRLFRAVCLAN